MSGNYGKVYLVGSGPGDPELLTLKARRLIDSAEVIVYDQLPGKAILDSMPVNAEKIDVGKYAGNHTMKGAFDAALRGLHNCQEEGIKVGLRFTINKQNVRDIPAIFDLLEKEKIPRICFYHLVYAGRGSKMVNEDLSLDESRQAVDLILERTRKLHEKGFPAEVLTVDNHCDGPYLYMK